MTGGRWLEGAGERHQGLTSALGSKKRLGTTSEFVLSQNRNETFVNLRLLDWNFTSCISELPAGALDPASEWESYVRIVERFLWEIHWNTTKEQGKPEGCVRSVCSVGLMP